MNAWNAQWDQVTEHVAEAVADLPWNWFLILECEPGPGQRMGPYAQVSRYAGGFHVEAVSETYLPDVEWPLDAQALRDDGWSAPDGVVDNWWQELDDPVAAARLMVRSLTEARGCSDAEAVSWQVGQHPDPPGDGEPLPGEVVDLTSRRAVA